jgi:Essential protein Yae1, N terminal
MAENAPTSDPFEDVLNLEEQFYNEGYQQGLADGIKAGRIEGRSVGMGQGFDKFFESGMLHGKALVWAGRLQKSSVDSNSGNVGLNNQKDEITKKAPERKCTLPPLPGNPRLEKNVTTLYALVEPSTFSTANMDEAVDDFNDRVKRAQGKAKIIEKMIEGTFSKESFKEVADM